MFNPCAFDLRAASFALTVALTLAGCQSGSEWLSSDQLPSPASSGVGAVFAPKNGSAAGGTVRIAAREDGVAITVYVTGLTPGQYSVTFHANGNCSSPNAFSAGPQWAPPGVAPARLWLPSSTEGGSQLSVRLRGYKLDGPDGLIGKSVVLHDATGTLDAQAGVPNSRIACGVIGPMRLLTF